MDARILRVVALLAGTALFSLAAAACGGNDGSTPSTASSTGPTLATAAPSASAGAAATATASSSTASAPTIRVADNSFSPATVTVAPGTTVTWDWIGTNAPHSVVGSFNGVQVKSETLTGNGQFSFTFSSAGTFEYVCGVHGASMPGRVVVR